MSALDDIATASARDARLVRAWRKEQPMGDPDAVAALVNAVRALRTAGIDHALIGGVAVGIHSEAPRATQDVLLAIPSTIDRDHVARVFAEAGFTPVGSFPHSLNFRHSSGEPVQLSMDPEFDPMKAHPPPKVRRGGICQYSEQILEGHQVPYRILHKFFAAVGRRRRAPRSVADVH